MASAATVVLDGNLHDASGGDRWQVETTDPRGSARDLVLPDTLHGDLIVNAHLVLDGSLTVMGNLTIGTATGASFDAGPGTRTVQGDLTAFNGTGPQAVAVGSTADHPQANLFQNVEIVNTTGVTVTRDARALGQLEIVGRMATEAALTIPLGGSLLLRSGSFVPVPTSTTCWAASP